MIPRDRISFFLFLLVLLMGVLVLLLAVGVYFGRVDNGFGRDGFSGFDSGSDIAEQLRGSVLGTIQSEATTVIEEVVEEETDDSEVKSVTASDLGFIDYPVVEVDGSDSVWDGPEQS